MDTTVGHKRGNELLAKKALAILLFSIGAFALKAIMEPERLVRYTPLVILHGVTMIVWMGVFAFQARLAPYGNLARHRNLGRWSPLVVTAMVASGMTVSWNLSQEFDRYEVLIGNVGIFATFIPLYIGAILFARSHRAAEHRQAMLLGNLALLGPAYARVFDAFDLPEFTAGPLQFILVPALAILLDKVSRGHVAKSTWWMLAFYFGVLIATVVVFLQVSPPI